MSEQRERGSRSPGDEGVLFRDYGGEDPAPVEPPEPSLDYPGGDGGEDRPGSGTGGGGLGDADAVVSRSPLYGKDKGRQPHGDDKDEKPR